LYPDSDNDSPQSKVYTAKKKRKFLVLDTSGKTFLFLIWISGKPSFKN